MAEHNKLGKEGEKVAENHLIAKGHHIRERNWYSAHKELDLITEHEGWLVVVEVKTRTGYTWEPPEDAITEAKIRHIVRAAHHYVCLNQIDLPVRFDVVSVVFDNGIWSVEHFEDAFLSPYK
jgi:putative endonuclease